MALESKRLKFRLFSKKDKNEIITQGGSWSPLQCSVQIDTLGKECQAEGKALYTYKDFIFLCPLAMVDDILTISECGIQSVATNSFINSKIEMKKLTMGPKKCKQIHVGRGNIFCPTLNVHGDPIEVVSTEKYLGDILCNNGKLDKNIESRINKGTGRTNTIMSLLEEISFGDSYFEMAILFRNSMFINSVLSNSETLYNIESKHITKLENSDKILLTKIFSVPTTTSYEAVYLETGILPIRFILQGRRLMYYWSLLHKGKDELVKSSSTHKLNFRRKMIGLSKLMTTKKI